MSLRSILFATVLVAAAIPVARAQESDLFIDKTGPGIAAADTDVPFNISVTNLGPDASATVTLKDVVAGGWSFVSFTQNSGPVFACTDPGAGATIGMVNCTTASLLAGSSATFTVVFHIPPATPPGTFFTNVATVSSPTDPNSENDSSTAVTSTPPPPQADLGVNKSGPPSATPDSDVSYTITVTNGGPDPASDVTLSDTLPGTMTFVSFTQNSGPAMSCTPGTTTTCTATTFPAGGTAVFTLVGHIPAGTSSGASFTNTATVSSTTSDPNPVNDTSSTLLIVRTADVSVTKTGPPAANAGTNVNYVITVTNGGPDAADGVSMSDNLPPGSTFVSLTQDTGFPTICATPGAGSGGTITCSFLSDMASAESAQFTLVTTIGPGPTVNNTATVTSNSGDPNSANNSSTATTNVTTIVDVSVTKNGNATAANGSNITYTITVNKAGPSPAPNTTLADSIPANTTFVSLNQSGPAFSCITPSAGGTGAVSCSIPALAAGATTTFTLVVNVNPSTPAATVVTNTANVSSAGTDTNGGNNSANATTTTTASPTDVGIIKTAAPGLRATGQPITYNIAVTNNGPAFAFGVAVSDILTGVTFVSATPSQGSCSGTTTVTCNLGGLVPSATATITLNATLGPTPGPVSNTATVAISNGDTNPANDSSTVTVTVIDAALIPALSPSALAMLGLAMAALALLALRR